MGKKRAILWFRQDLRLHDNEAMAEALKSADEIVPLYIFDDRVFKAKTSFGFEKTGAFRSQFIIESVKDLRQSLREIGSELYVRTGLTEDIIFDIGRQLRASYTFCNRERTRDEVVVQDTLEQKLWTIGQEVRYSRGKMLYYTADLPFPVNHTPDQFSTFKKETERIIPVRSLIPLDKEITQKTYTNLEPGIIPSLDDFNIKETKDTRPDVQLGGEMNGIIVLKSYLWDERDTDVSSLLNRGPLSHLSAYLSQGCLSPKKLYHEMKRFEQSHGLNQKIRNLFNKLIYRDYLRLIAKKYGKRIFEKGGIKQLEFKGLNTNDELFLTWANGETDNEFVNANMTQLNKTGFMSNHGRETVAAYLIYELGIDWRMGAEYFESKLIDYDPCSNWVNWNQIAGLGPENREKVINSQTAGKRFDPSGEYVKQWLSQN